MRDEYTKRDPRLFGQLEQHDQQILPVTDIVDRKRARLMREERARMTPDGMSGWNVYESWNVTSWVPLFSFWFSCSIFGTCTQFLQSIGSNFEQGRDCVISCGFIPDFGMYGLFFFQKGLPFFFPPQNGRL